jgi:aminoglycoside phosphotransferase (APT) family kinase protein
MTVPACASLATMANETERITAHLSAVLDGAHIDELRRLSGGASRDTWRFTADGRPLVLQRQRGGATQDMALEADVLRIAHTAGVRVPEVLASGRDDDSRSFTVLSMVDGETIARKILRDDDFARARAALVGDMAESLVRLHAADPDSVVGLSATDQVAQYRSILDQLGQPHPTFELVFRWLEDHRPAPTRDAIVHGDFRLGNVIVDADGLAAVIDWELVHRGDPMEDLGWLCVKAWRFGSPHPVAGLADYDALFTAYEAAGGPAVDPDVVRWWEVLGTLKWGVMCIVQASVHLSGASRSHELAAIGRRVCENEHDLFLALEGRW